MTSFLIVYVLGFVCTVPGVMNRFEWKPGGRDSYWRGIRTVPQIVPHLLVWPVTMFLMYRHPDWRIKEW